MSHVLYSMDIMNSLILLMVFNTSFCLTYRTRTGTSQAGTYLNTLTIM